MSYIEFPSHQFDVSLFVPDEKNEEKKPLEAEKGKVYHFKVVMTDKKYKELQKENNQLDSKHRLLQDESVRHQQSSLQQIIQSTVSLY